MDWNFFTRPWYRHLIWIPLVLVAISLPLIFLAPGLRSGVELVGGNMLVIQSPQPFSLEELKARVTTAFPNAEVRGLSPPTGFGAEVEWPLSDEIERLDSLVSEVRRLRAELTTAQLKLAELEERGDAGAGEQRKKVNELSAALLAKASEALHLAKYDATNVNEANALAFSEEALEGARMQERERIDRIVKEVAPQATTASKQVGASLSRFFLLRLREIVAIALALCALATLVIFRRLVTSLIAIFAASADIIITMGAMALLGIPLALASVAALLMLIGLALDTNIMLTIRAIRRREATPQQRMFEAMTTAAMMNITTVVAFGVLAWFGAMLGIATYAQIGAVVAIGGVADFITTWFGNAPLLLMWMEKKRLV